MGCFFVHRQPLSVVGQRHAFGVPVLVSTLLDCPTCAMTSFSAYYRGRDSAAQEQGFKSYLEVLLRGECDEETSVDETSHVIDLWLDYFSVEIRREVGSDDEDDPWKASERSAAEAGDGMSTEIISARDWLSSQDGRLPDSDTHCTLLIHNVYNTHPDSSPPSPTKSKENRSDPALSRTNSFSSRSGFDLSARAVLDSVVMVSSEGNSVSDGAGYAALSAAIGGDDARASSRDSKSIAARTRAYSKYSTDGGGWSRHDRQRYDMPQNRRHFLWIIHALAHLCRSSANREAIFKRY